MDTQLQPIRLILNAGRFTNENDEIYTGYGFTAYRGTPEQELFTIEDLSVDPAEVQELIDLILNNDVSPASFENLIENFRHSY